MAQHDIGSLAGRIQQRMDDLGLNAYSAARKAGLGDSFVRDILREKVKKPSAERLAKLAEALECSLNYLLGHPETPPRLPQAFGADGEPLEAPEPLINPLWTEWGGKPGMVMLPIRYELMRGAFREAVEVKRDLGFEAASTVIPYADRDQWYEVVRDDSSNLVAPPGSLLQVAKFSDKDRPILGEGDVVIVERHLIGPDAAYYMVERSVRIIHRRYPDLGLWFLEYAAADAEYWGISDDIFRDEKSPDLDEISEERLQKLVEILREIAPGPRTKEENEAMAQSFIQERKLRPRIVAKVLRAVIPIDPGSSFGFTTAKKSGHFPN